MPIVRREVILMHSAQQLYELVDDIDRYSEFIPWCESSCVVKKIDGATKLGALVFSYHGLSQKLVTRNHCSPGLCIDVELVEGPFSKLCGQWAFNAIDAFSCQVVLRFEYEVVVGLDRVLSRPLDKAFGKVVDVFCARAEVLYGRN